MYSYSCALRMSQASYL